MVDKSDKYEDRIVTKTGHGVGMYMCLLNPNYRTYDPYQELAYTIIYQQIYDLDKCLKKLIREGVKIEKIRDTRECLTAWRFFNSQWFLELCSDNLDGKRIFEKALDNFEKYGTVYNMEE